MQPLPHLAIVIVLTEGGPYRPGDICSLAFLEKTVGRLVPHVGHGITSEPSESGIVPESISARVVTAAEPYAAGELLTLSFLDPSIARIHLLPPQRTEHCDAAIHLGRMVPTLDFDVSGPDAADACNDIRAECQEMGVPGNDVGTLRRSTTLISFSSIVPISSEFVVHSPLNEPLEHLEEYPQASTSAVRTAAVDKHDASGNLDVSGGVEVRLEWTSERVRRFITVVDRLFTVERLGWYRHVLAMRLLIPDRIGCGNQSIDLETITHLLALRAAAVETLGRPLLEAFMPNFTVTPEWLDSLDSAQAARALASVRDSIEPFVLDEVREFPDETVEAAWTIGHISRGDFLHASGSCIDAFMPVFIASTSRFPKLTERLSAYRRALIDVFGQTARSAEAVRLGAMTQPNHSLDDRLWQLVGEIGETFGGLAVA